jgi:hypothetical protein
MARDERSHFGFLHARGNDRHAIGNHPSRTLARRRAEVAE